MQAWQVPQWSVAGGSTSRGRSVYSSPRKEPGSGRPVEEVGVLADPSETGIARQRLLHDGGAVREGPITEGACLGLDMVGKALQAASDHLVIVAAEGVSGDVAELRIPENGFGVGSAAEIVHAHADDADGSRHQLGRPGASHPVAGHVLELTVVAAVEPFEQRRFVAAQVDAGNRHLLKAELQPAAPYRRGQRRIVDIPAAVAVEQGGGPRWPCRSSAKACARLRIWLF